MASAGLNERVAAIEARLGPVGKGHHNSHRTAHILQWLEGKKETGVSSSKKHPFVPAGKNPADQGQPPFPPKKAPAKKGHGHIPPQFLKHEGQHGKAASSKKNSAAVAKRLAALQQKGN